MTRRIPVLGLLIISSLLVACGGSKHSAATSTGSSTAAPQGSSHTSSGRPSTGGTGTGGPVAGAYPGTKQAGAAMNVRVPATFSIHAGGVLSPTTVSSPAFIAIRLTVLSGDGRAHRVQLLTPSSRSLTVPAQGHASVLVPGLKAGRYALEVDGVARGALVVGGEPGP